MANEKRLIDANALIEEANAEGAYGYVDDDDNFYCARGKRKYGDGNG